MRCQRTACPDLAESYDFDESTLTYTFHLRQDVLWHDGEPFDAEDVVFTYEAGLTSDKTLSSSITSNYEDICTIDSPDASYRGVHLTTNTAPLFSTISPWEFCRSICWWEKTWNTCAFNQAPIEPDATVLLNGTRRRNDQTGTQHRLLRKVPNIKRII